MNYTFGMIKSHAVANKDIGKILKRIEQTGIKVKKVNKENLTEEKSKILYQEHDGAWFQERLIKSVTSGPIMAMLLEGKNVIEEWRTLMGPSNPEIAPKGTIRGDFGTELPFNAVHGSDSEENALREIELFFPKFFEEELKKKPAILTQDKEYYSPNLKVYGEHDAQTIEQMHTCLSVGNVVGGVICADGHLGYAQPVGGVIAYENMVSISGVGFDIGCGNMAVKTNLNYGWVKNNIPSIAKKLSREISFGIGRINNTRVEHELFDDLELWNKAGVNNLKDIAYKQLGTVGSGNHYVDLFYEVLPDVDPEESKVWVGVHFGSRGLGHKSATKYIKQAGGKDGIMVAPTVISVDTELGERYLSAMELAGKYAYAGREWVVGTVVKILKTKVLDTIHNHHNYAWKETHNGKDLYVVRKGATPAFPGERGFVGGSMGDNAVIISGLDSPISRDSFYSTVHGSGRLFGRRKAKETFTKTQMHDWLQKENVTLIGGGLDESPMAYRRLDEVLKEHKGTIKVEHVLKPFLVMMAGEDVYDPFKEG